MANTACAVVLNLVCHELRFSTFYRGWSWSWRQWLYPIRQNPSSASTVWVYLKNHNWQLRATKTFRITVMFRRVLKQGCFGLTWTPEKLEHSDFGTLEWLWQLQTKYQQYAICCIWWNNRPAFGGKHLEVDGDLWKQRPPKGKQNVGPRSRPELKTDRLSEEVGSGRFQIRT